MIDLSFFFAFFRGISRYVTHRSRSKNYLLASPSCPSHMAFKGSCLLSCTLQLHQYIEPTLQAKQLLLLPLTKCFQPRKVLPSQPEKYSEVSLSGVQYSAVLFTITNARPHTERFRKSLLAELGIKFSNDKNLQA